jgi:tRNA(Ile)-lysidine synthase TilS/MesJ
MDNSRAAQIFENAAPVITRAMSLFALPSSGRVLVGASGGKDSTFLALFLRHLGFDVECLVVDLRYPNFEAPRIRDALQDLGLTATVCDLRAEMENESYLKAGKEALKKNFLELDSDECTTPCGACSRNKRTALAEYAASRNIRYVALGHHREDFLATLLKDYFVHCYHATHGSYDRCRFQEFVSCCPIDKHQLDSLCSAHKASTMAVRLRLNGSTELIRPMLFMPEQDIIEARDKLGLATFSSGCSHASFSSPQAEPTKREIVHAELTRRLSDDPDLACWLAPIALSSLNQDGRPVSNPRSNRARTLPGFDPLAS